MNSKKSMHIFLVTLFLLVVSGCTIIGVLHEKELLKNQQEMLRKEVPEEGGRENLGHAADDTSYISQAHALSAVSKAAIRQTSGRTVSVQYEIVVENGYLNVYHFHSKELYFRTGIALDMLDESARKELQEQGKLFENEQELYGYLESCTS